MRERLKFILSYYLFWLFYFFFVKIIFLLYNLEHTRELDWETIYKIMLFGFKLDLSFASYISVIPFLIVAVSSFFPNKYFRYILLTFTSILLFILTFISIVDLELYKAWGYRLDSTPLMYLNTPREMIASAGSSPWLLLVTIMLITLLSSWTLFYYFIYPKTIFIKKNGYWGIFFFLLLAVSLFVPIRGGFQLAPLNVSNVYFSKNHFANHAAINVAWNFFFSVINKENDIASNYQYFPEKEAFKIVRELQAPASEPAIKLFKVEKPNIIFITWESFTAKVVAETGGLVGVTPNFSQLCNEGLLLNNMYSTGDRSDKGLIGILSGYPAQAHGSIINVPKKAEKLPSLAHDLGQAGYSTAFYYGGEMEFANIKSYFLNNFDKIVSKNDFATSEMNSKWGAHDDVVLQRLMKDLKQAKQPFFYNIFTLSSHEPFEIPIKSKYPGSAKDSLFLSSIAYTDQAIGDFVKEAKKQSWWNNTIIIITADHGTPLPGNTAYNVKLKFHVPFLIVGGALNHQPGVFDKVCSQTDIAKTLLDQLKINSSAYLWSNDIFNPLYPGYAYYVFNDGFGFVTKDQYVIYDHTLKSTTYYSNPDTAKVVEKGKALSQMISKDFKMK
jgi:phosphoglycerol transferase MdoB-like AlkP superfamily enzyme